MRSFLILLAAFCWLGAPLSAWAHDHVQIAQQNMPAVVAVNVLKKDGSTFTGTGFVLTQDGLIATSRHVLDDALYLNLTFSNGTVSGEAVPLAQDDVADVALLKIQAEFLPYTTLAADDNALPGQTITVIGNPRRLQNTVTSGIISQVRPQKDGTRWLQISAPISPSSSGSPVFNEKGEVIAMAFATLSGEDNQNLNFALPVAYIHALAAQAGISLPGQLPTPVVTPAGNPFVRHIKKSWQISKRLLHRWFSSQPAKDNV